MHNLLSGCVIIIAIKLIIKDSVNKFVLRLYPVHLPRGFLLLDSLWLSGSLFGFKLLGILMFRLLI